MSGRNVQRKLGTTRGSPRRSRTAKASRISRYAVKSQCACEWGGWGRLSDDGPGQNNPDPSEGPGGRWSIPPHGGALSSPQARLRTDHRSDHEVHEGRMQTGWRTANAGSRLKPLITQEGTVWKANLPAGTEGKPAVRNDRGSRKRRHHSKPDPRLDPTRPRPKPGPPATVRLLRRCTCRQRHRYSSGRVAVNAGFATLRNPACQQSGLLRLFRCRIYVGFQH